MYQCQMYDVNFFSSLSQWFGNDCPQIAFGNLKNQWLVEVFYQISWFSCFPLYLTKLFLLRQKAKQINVAHLNGQKLDIQVPLLPRFDWRQYVFVGAPELLNIISSSLSFSAMRIAGNITQLFSFCTALCLFLLNKYAMQREFKKHQLVSVVIGQIACIGLVLMSCIVYGFINNDVKNEIIGCVLSILAFCLLAVQFTLEDAIFTRLSSDPLQVLGMEGIWGLVFLCVIMLPVDMYGNFTVNKQQFIYQLHNTFYAFKVNSALIYIFIAYSVVQTILSWGRLALMKVSNSLGSYVFYFVVQFIAMIIQMIIGFVDQNTQYGYPWTNESYVDIICCVLVFFAQHLYFGDLCFKFRRGTKRFDKIQGDQYI